MSHMRFCFAGWILSLTSLLFSACNGSASTSSPQEPPGQSAPPPVVFQPPPPASRPAETESTPHSFSETRSESSPESVTLSAPEKPRVSATLPTTGSGDVDPALGEIVITFDREMQRGRFSLNFGAEREKFPEPAGQPSFSEDGRKCFVPVRLRPGHDYEVMINSPQGGNFVDLNGTPAEHFRLAFRTRAFSVASVSSSTPSPGARDVSPGLKQITITFDKRMKPGTWSWNFGADRAKFPKISGQPWFLDDGLTCVLPVELEPGKEYELWANSPQGGKFVDEEGTPAKAFHLTFTTGLE